MTNNAPVSFRVYGYYHDEMAENKMVCNMAVFDTYRDASEFLNIVTLRTDFHKGQLCFYIPGQKEQKIREFIMDNGSLREKNI